MYRIEILSTSKSANGDILDLELFETFVRKSSVPTVARSLLALGLCNVLGVTLIVHVLFREGFDYITSDEEGGEETLKFFTLPLLYSLLEFILAYYHSIIIRQAASPKSCAQSSCFPRLPRASIVRKRPMVPPVLSISNHYV